jgi:hypothetical protein
MSDVLPHLSWHLAAGLMLFVLGASVLRSRGGAAGRRIGAAMVWMTFAASLAWAGSGLLAAMAALRA